MGHMGQPIDYTFTLSIENEARKFLNDIYLKRGFKIKRLCGKENKKNDLILIHPKGEWKIEEKSASYYAPFMPFEEHQDYPNWDGWIFYTEAEIIIYFYFDEGSPFICFLVD
jgi:hypothetical protein